MQITMSSAYPAWLRMTLDCSRIAKEIVIVSGFLQVTRIRKIREICEANLTSPSLPETGRSQSNEP